MCHPRDKLGVYAPPCHRIDIGRHRDNGAVKAQPIALHAMTSADWTLAQTGMVGR
ncbi:MAG: hypothetical protein ABGX16_11605 [Pirellulales bacterium]